MAASPIVARLVKAHAAYAKREGFEDDGESAPWTAADFAKLEELAGVALPPLMKEIYSTRGAFPWFGVSASEYPGFEWASRPEVLVDRIEGAKRLAEGGDLPESFLCVTTDEDYLAVLDDGRLVQVCSNEANIEDEEPMGVTTYDAFIARYCELLEGELGEG